VYERWSQAVTTLYIPDFVQRLADLQRQTNSEIQNYSQQIEQANQRI